MLYTNYKNNQIFWYNFANYLGFIFSFVASIYLYPKNLNLLGEIRYIETIGHLIFPIILFGLPQALVKFSPKMLTYHLPRFYGNSIFIIITISIIIYCILYLFNYIFSFTNYIYYIYGFILAICYSFIDLNKSISIILGKVKIPVILEKILPKIVLPIIFILLLNNILKKEESINYYIILHFLLVITLFIIIFKDIIPVFSRKYYFLFEKFTVKEYMNFSFYSFISSIGFLLAFKIDSYMIPHFLSMEDNGIYSIAFTISSFLGVPMSGYFLINSHIVSQLIKDENFKELEIKYKESATYLYWIGSLIFCIILILFPFFDYFINNPTQVNVIKIIIVLLCISFLINMGTSYNTEIINYSKYYKFNLYSILFLVVSNISINLFFLTQTNYQLIGVAIASLISMILYNFFKLIFIYRKFKILPFNTKYFKVFLISILFYILIFLLPNFSSNIVTFLYKTLIIIILYLYFIYKFNLISNVNEKLKMYLK